MQEFKVKTRAKDLYMVSTLNCATNPRRNGRLLIQEENTKLFHKYNTFSLNDGSILTYALAKTII